MKAVVSDCRGFQILEAVSTTNTKNRHLMFLGFSYESEIVFLFFAEISIKYLYDLVA